MGAQKNRLIETVLVSTLNICLGVEIRKIVFQYALVSMMEERDIPQINYGIS